MLFIFFGPQLQLQLHDVYFTTIAILVSFLECVAVVIVASTREVVSNCLFLRQVSLGIHRNTASIGLDLHNGSRGSFVMLYSKHRVNTLCVAAVLLLPDLEDTGGVG